MKCGVSIHGNIIWSYKGSTDTYYILDETWKHYAKWKKPVTKVHMIPCIFPFIWKSKIIQSIETESRLAVGWAVGGSRMTAKRYKISFWCDENVLKLTVAVIALICEYTQNHWITHFKCVHFIICELHLSKAVLLFFCFFFLCSCFLSTCYILPQT